MLALRRGQPAGGAIAPNGAAAHRRSSEGVSVESGRCSASGLVAAHLDLCTTPVRRRHCLLGVD